MLVAVGEQVPRTGTGASARSGDTAQAALAPGLQLEQLPKVAQALGVDTSVGLWWHLGLPLYGLPWLANRW